MGQCFSNILSGRRQSGLESDSRPSSVTHVQCTEDDLQALHPIVVPAVLSCVNKPYCICMHCSQLQQGVREGEHFLTNPPPVNGECYDPLSAVEERWLSLVSKCTHCQADPKDAPYAPYNYDFPDYNVQFQQQPFSHDQCDTSFTAHYVQAESYRVHRCKLHQLSLLIATHCKTLYQMTSLSLHLHCLIVMGQ